MNNLTRERSLRMRGAAIFMIYIHNFLHKVGRVKENEFSFTLNRAEEILNSFFSFSSSFIADFFSYFGWYGVSVFMFFSGYGLVLKHESAFMEGDSRKQEKQLRIVPYLWNNFLKLFVLMTPSYFIYLLVTSHPFFSKMTLAQFTMTSNLYCPIMITPGVFWYFGLTLQFYVFYLLFYRFRSKAFLLATIVFMMIISVVVEFMTDYKIEGYLRHNSPMWLPVFLLGVWYARQKSVQGLAFIRKHWMISLFLFAILWFWSAVNAWMWVFSPLLILFILGIICIPLCERTGNSGFCGHLSVLLSRCLTFFGGISAGIFVCNPIIRVFAVKAYRMGYSLLIVTLVYAVVCVLVAMVYNNWYKRVMRILFPK